MRLIIRTVTATVVCLTLIWLIWFSTGRKELDHVEIPVPVSYAQKNDNDRSLQVRAAFQHAWNGYSKYCMGHDTLHPVTNTCDDEFGGLGVSAIDALSTAIIMEDEQIVVQILRFISKINWTKVRGGTSLQLFEVTIRHFGGMISAYDLLTGPFPHVADDKGLREALYKQMVALGDRLACAFNTPTGIPRNWVNPGKCKTDTGKTNSVAGVGSLVLEFQRLSDITGDPKYGDMARKAESYLINPRPAVGEPFPGLLTSYVTINSGLMNPGRGSWGSLSDSFYEYLIKAYIYNSIEFAPYLDRWKLAADSTISKIASHPYGHANWTLLPFWEGEELHTLMDSLSWFAGGNFILGGMVTKNQTLIDFGLSITDTGGELYMSTPTKLGGEFVTWRKDCSSNDDCTVENSVEFGVKKFILRPELFESWYYAYRATKDAKYREWAWTSFLALNRVCKTSSGFAGITDVTLFDGGSKIDKQESFVYAEVFKYMYLILTDDETAPYHVQDSRTGSLNGWVFNTEAHPLRVVGPHV